MGISIYGLYAVAIVTAATVCLRTPSFVRSSVVPSLVGSYVAWAGAVLSLLPWPESILFVFLPLLILLGEWGERFVWLLAGPIKFALAALIVAGLIVRVLVSVFRPSTTTRLLAALTLNIFFIALVLGFATKRADHSISTAAALLHPVCIQKASLLESIRHNGNSLYAHAIVRVADGTQYYWSYSKQRFFEGNESLDPNFPCVEKAL